MFRRIQTGMAIALCASFILLVSGTVQAQDAANPVVCKVNGKEITEKDILNEIDEMIKSAGRQVNPAMLPQFKVTLYTRALENIQDKMLLKKVAEEKKIVVTPEDIDKQYALITKQIPSEEELKKALAANGLTPETLKERMKEQMIYQKVLSAEVKEATPTDDEVQKYYNDNKAKMKQEEQVKASHILIAVKAADSADVKAKAKEKLQGIRKDIIDKKITFADAAKQNSDCPSKERGGDLGTFGKGQMVAEFDKVAFTLKPAEISDVFETKFGYHIVQVNEHQEAKDLTLDETRDQIRARLLMESLQKAQEAYLVKLKTDAKIETLVDQKAWEAKFAPKKEEKPAGEGIQINPNDLKP